MDIDRIRQLLPHRYPFLLVDRILEVQGGTKIVGIKNVTINEPFFQGHFPGHPIMPGVLIVEALAQVGGCLALGARPDGAGAGTPARAGAGAPDPPEPKVVYLVGLDRVRFRRPVRPGDQLRLEVELVQVRGPTCRLKGVALVDGAVAAEAELLAQVVDR